MKNSSFSRVLEEIREMDMTNKVIPLLNYGYHRNNALLLTKLDLFEDLIHQIAITRQDVILHLTISNSFKMFSRVSNFQLFCTFEAQCIQTALRFGNEINMFHILPIEYNSPIRIVIANRR